MEGKEKQSKGSGKQKEWEGVEGEGEAVGKRKGRK